MSYERAQGGSRGTWTICLLLLIGTIVSVVVVVVAVVVVVVVAAAAAAVVVVVVAAAQARFQVARPVFQFGFTTDGRAYMGQDKDCLMETLHRAGQLAPASLHNFRCSLQAA